jgi:F-type H+-transporting ATPase subunit b
MPAFLTAEFWALDNPELWVGVGLILFLGILWMAGAFRMAMGALDAKSAKIQSELDEAARLRADAEAMLADIRKQRDESEALAKQMLADAKAEAKRLAGEAKTKLEEQIVRRTELADRRIAAAEAQAAAEVKAAAAELAANITEQVLIARLKGAKSDPLVDKAITQLGDRLQ